MKKNIDGWKTMQKIWKAQIKISADKQRRRKEKLGPVESLRTDPIFAVVLARGNLIKWRAFIGGAKRRHLLYIKARHDLKLIFLSKFAVISLIDLMHKTR